MYRMRPGRDRSLRSSFSNELHESDSVRACRRPLPSESRVAPSWSPVWSMSFRVGQPRRPQLTPALVMKKPQRLDHQAVWYFHSPLRSSLLTLCVLPLQSFLASSPLRRLCQQTSSIRCQAPGPQIVEAHPRSLFAADLGSRQTLSSSPSPHSLMKKSRHSAPQSPFPFSHSRPPCLISPLSFWALLLFLSEGKCLLLLLLPGLPPHGLHPGLPHGLHQVSLALPLPRVVSLLCWHP
mmetsp:Transcript_21335/g.52223  ORF Transcript_21335/g.52223 Transcript_21335/m.52223 type:complete len:237 (-) Transcript_21335:959-1669(-)